MSSKEYVEMLYNRKRKRTTSVPVKRCLGLKGGVEDMNQFDESFENAKVHLKGKLGRNPTNLEVMNFLLKVFEEQQAKSEIKTEPDDK